MTYFAYIFSMLVGTCAAGVVWVWTLFSINPETSGAIGLFLFFVSLFLVLVGVFALLGLFFRVVIFQTQEMRFFVVRDSFRQSVLLSVMIESILMFQRYGLMTWWAFVLLFLLVVSLEFFLSAGHHVRHV